MSELTGVTTAVRIVLAAGPWQIVMAAAALEQADRDAPRPTVCRDVLVLYGVNPNAAELVRAMNEVAQAARAWERVVWAMDTLSAPTYERRWNNHFHRPDLKELLARVTEKIGAAPAEVGELWVCTLHTPAEKLVVEAYSSARIFIYEEGLQNYVPQRSNAWPVSARWQQPRAALGEALGALFTDPIPTRRIFRGWSCVSGRHRARIAALYLYIVRDLAVADPLMQIPLCRIENEVLRAVVTRCANIALLRESFTGPPTAPITSVKGTVLVLGQCYAMFDWISKEGEIAVYAEAVAALLKEGHTVLWKDHPRLPDSYFPAIARMCGVEGQTDRFRPVVVPAVVPIEFAAERLGLVGCVAGTSSALFYLRHLYDIKTYSFAGQFAEALPRDPSVMNDLVRRAVSPIAHLSRVALSAPLCGSVEST